MIDDREKTEAGGKASVAISGNAIGSHVTTTQAEAPGGKVEINNYYGSAGAPPTSSISAPINNLPSVAAAFTGRGREEEEIVAALAGGGRSAVILALKGIGGVGKTALAVKIGHRLTVQFPDSQLLVDLRGTSEIPTAARAAMESVIRRFHPEGQLPDDDAAVLEIYRDLLRRKRVLLVLDNAKDTAQVGQLLPPPPSAAIVTSRQVLHLADARSVRLDDLPLPEATVLVLKLLDGTRSMSETELRRLAQDCCLCHPLSLRVAALFLKGHKGRSVSDYVASVAKDRTRLKLQGLADHDVLAVIGQSVDQLQAEDEALSANWRDLSVFPSGFDTAAATAVWSIDDRDIGSDRLSDFDRRGLIEVVAEDRYRLHDLLRDVGRRDWPAEKAELVAQRHAEHFRSVLNRADTLYLKGGASIAEGLSLFDRERTNIEAGQRWAAAGAPPSEDAARLAAAYANAGANVLSLRLHPREQIGWHEAALEGCQRIGDRGGESYALGNLGIAYRRLSEVRTAIEHLERQLTIAREIRDRAGEGNALRNLGIAYRHLGENRRAIEHHEPALTIAREIGDRRGEGNALGSLGNAHATLGETRRAIELYEEQLTVAREIGNRRGESAGLGDLGNAYADLGEPRRAIEYYKQQLIIAREIGDRRGEGNALGSLGNAHAALGETRRAIELYEEQLTVAREIGNRRGEGNALGNLGSAYRHLVENRRAIEYHEQQLMIVREIGDRGGESGALANLGLAMKYSDPEAARVHWQAALAIYKAIEDPNAARVAQWLTDLKESPGHRADPVQGDRK